MVSVKPEMMVEFQNFMKNTTNPALKKGGLKWREVWQTTGAAGDAFEYVLVSPVAKLAEFDGPSALEKGLGPQGLRAWQTKAGALVNSVRRFIIRTRPDLSFAGQRTGAPKLAVVHMVHVAPNRTNEYENFLKADFVPVMKQAGVTYLVSQTIFGGNGNEYITLTMRDSFADLDKGPVHVQALLLRRAAEFLPAVVEAEIVGRRMCARPQSVDGRPFIGPVAGSDGLFVCGDHRDTSSIQGALVSGERAARAVLEDLGHEVIDCGAPGEVAITGTVTVATWLIGILLP